MDRIYGVAALIGIGVSSITKGASLLIAAASTSEVLVDTTNCATNAVSPGWILTNIREFGATTVFCVLFFWGIIFFIRKLFQIQTERLIEKDSRILEEKEEQKILSNVLSNERRDIKAEVAANSSAIKELAKEVEKLAKEIRK